MLLQLGAFVSVSGGNRDRNADAVHVEGIQNLMRSGPGKPKEEARYANSFQVRYNACEFLLEFGQRGGRIHSSIYVSPQHAKMLSELLSKALKEYAGRIDARMLPAQKAQSNIG